MYKVVILVRILVGKKWYIESGKFEESLIKGLYSKALVESREIIR